MALRDGLNLAGCWSNVVAEHIPSTRIAVVEEYTVEGVVLKEGETEQVAMGISDSDKQPVESNS